MNPATDAILPDLLDELLSQWDAAQAPIENQDLVALQAAVEAPAEPVTTSDNDLPNARLVEVGVPLQAVDAENDALLQTLLAESIAVAEAQDSPRELEVPEWVEERSRKLEERLAWAAKLQVGSTLATPLPTQKFVQFTVSGESFAVPVGRVAETGYLPEVTPLPAVDASVRGLINYRGEVLPVLNLRHVLLRDHQYVGGVRDERVIIVRAAQGYGSCALPADGVVGLLSLWPEEILPEVQGMAGGSFVQGFGQRQGEPVRLLDLEKMFASLSEGRLEDHV
jgi:purine-binding chemotaxis protein CheW